MTEQELGRQILLAAFDDELEKIAKERKPLTSREKKILGAGAFGTGLGGGAAIVLGIRNKQWKNLTNRAIKGMDESLGLAESATKALKEERRQTREALGIANRK